MKFLLFLLQETHPLAFLLLTNPIVQPVTLVKSGLFLNSLSGEKTSELVNSLAILCGAAQGKRAKRICDILTKERLLTPISLSMSCFKYDALLKVDSCRFKDFVLEDIESKYKRMLDAGATSFWETEKGEQDFDNAGSLCHGWSAMPAYYLSILCDN